MPLLSFPSHAVPRSPPPAVADACVTQYGDLKHAGIYNSVPFPVLTRLLEVFSLKGSSHGSLKQVAPCVWHRWLPSPASLAPCHQLTGIFGLPGTAHQCPGKQRENSKSRVGALFFFLVLTTSGKNLDENRGAAGMIEEGFLCGVCYYFFFF